MISVTIIDCNGDFTCVRVLGRNENSMKMAGTRARARRIMHISTQGNFYEKLFNKYSLGLMFIKSATVLFDCKIRIFNDISC